MRSLAALFLLVVAASAQLFYPPPVKWVNADQVAVAITINNNPFTGTGIIQYLSTKNPSATPFYTHLKGNVLSTYEGWSTFGFSNGHWMFTAFVDDPQTGCIEIVTGNGGSNGSITCNPWAQVPALPAAATQWTQQCTIQELGDTVVFSNSAVTNADKLTVLGASANILGNKASIKLQVQHALTTPPTQSDFTPCTPQARKQVSLGEFLMRTLFNARV